MAWALWELPAPYFAAAWNKRSRRKAGGRIENAETMLEIVPPNKIQSTTSQCPIGPRAVPYCSAGRRTELQLLFTFISVIAIYLMLNNIFDRLPERGR